MKCYVNLELHVGIFDIFRCSSFFNMNYVSKLIITYASRFRDCFPKTGSGEDVDLCARLGEALVSVPEAAVFHPWCAFQCIRGQMHLVHPVLMAHENPLCVTRWVHTHCYAE